MGTKCGKVVLWKINDELRTGIMLTVGGSGWSFVAGERDGDYGKYHAGYAVTGCTVEKDERKDGEFWVTIGDPKERGEGKPVKVLKAVRCTKTAGGDMEFDDEPTFTASLYSNGTGVLQGFLYIEEEEPDEEEEEVVPKKSNKKSGSSAKSSSGKTKGSGNRGVDVW